MNAEPHSFCVEFEDRSYLFNKLCRFLPVIINKEGETSKYIVPTQEYRKAGIFNSLTQDLRELHKKYLEVKRTVDSPDLTRHLFSFDFETYQCVVTTKYFMNNFVDDYFLSEVLILADYYNSSNTSRPKDDDDTYVIKLENLCDALYFVELYLDCFSPSACPVNGYRVFCGKGRHQEAEEIYPTLLKDFMRGRKGRFDTLPGHWFLPKKLNRK